MHAIQQQYWAVRDYLSPVLKESKFKEHGRITPEEFVAAGDFLTYKFPVWSWEAGEASRTRDFLPADKQYLITRGVPCLRRATSLAYNDEERLLSIGGGKGEDEWVETHTGRSHAGEGPEEPGEIDDIPDVDDENGVTNALGDLSLNGGKGAEPAEIPDIDEIPDMEEEDLEGEDDAAVAAPKKPAASKIIDASEIEPAKGNLLQVRTYDVLITYDKYYQTPRLWLLGYDENRNPLTPAQIFQDVSADHAFKTVTIEPFLHSATLQAASVHPCKHASVMKKVIERMNAGLQEEQAKKLGASAPKDKSGKKWLFRRPSGPNVKDQPAGEDEDEGGMRVDFYLVVFLKFIASIVPTIEIDSTTSF
ncbi:autophagocytosis associated protein [Irpex lacteus]|nr:autophagocytosis associated protein [Irpex lacteus]